jgi:hypothetical protein
MTLRTGPTEGAVVDDDAPLTVGAPTARYSLEGDSSGAKEMADGKNASWRCCNPHPHAHNALPHM